LKEGIFKHALSSTFALFPSDCGTGVGKSDLLW
jgi:hypothetical protein